MILKTKHESQNDVYADITANTKLSAGEVHVFNFKITSSERTGTIKHDASKHTVYMTYDDGTAVSPPDAAALSDALLAWLGDNGYLEQNAGQA